MLDQSFGIIPLLKKDKWYVYLVLHKSSKYWGFPKGHANKDESPKIAATRELKEETNLDVVKFISDEALIETYDFTYKKQKISKKVLYFLAEVQGEIKLQKEEILDGNWFDLKEAKEKLTFPQAKNFCNQVEKIIKKDS
jgi:bis(5'-nucleosidyl)-tetraphosphatase